MWRRRWKAHTQDWTALQLQDNTDVISVCLSTREIAILKSALTPLYWSTRWENLGTTQKVLTETIAEIDAKLDVECVPVTGIQDVRQNPDCKLQKLESSVWSDFADLTLCVSPTDDGNDYFIQQNMTIIQSNLYVVMYDGSTTSININTVVVTWDTDQSGLPDVDRQIALCMGTQAFVGAYCARKIQELDRFYLGVFLVLAGIAIITGGIGVAAGIAILGAALLPAWDYPTTRAALADVDAQQLVACCMMDGLAGIAVNEANFANAVASCGFGVGTNEEILRQYIEDSISNTVSYLAMLDILGKTYAQVAVFGANECNCDTWTQVFDFSIDGYLAEWSAIAYGGVTGSYDAINGYWEGACNTWPSNNIWLKSTISPTKITAIKITFENQQTRVGSRIAAVELDAVSVASTTTFGNGTVIVEPSALVPVVTTDIEVYMSAPCTSGCAGCYARITKIEISGIGINPF